MSTSIEKVETGSSSAACTGLVLNSSTRSRFSSCGSNLVGRRWPTAGRHQLGASAAAGPDATGRASAAGRRAALRVRRDRARRCNRRTARPASRRVPVAILLRRRRQRRRFGLRRRGRLRRAARSTSRLSPSASAFFSFAGSATGFGRRPGRRLVGQRLGDLLVAAEIERRFLHHVEGGVAGDRQRDEPGDAPASQCSFFCIISLQSFCARSVRRSPPADPWAAAEIFSSDRRRCMAASKARAFALARRAPAPRRRAAC